MKLDSSNPPVYLPQSEQASVLRLGLENRDIEDWLHPADDLVVFHQHKTALLKELGDRCFASTPGSSRAQAEFHNLLLEHLVQHPELGYRRTGNRLVQERQNLNWEISDENLWPASTWIAEDICILEDSDRGNDYKLTAASVCSPSNWYLEEKIGQSVAFIHGPVPGYDSVLNERVNRFLKGLRSGRVMLRYNWSIQPGNELCWRADQATNMNPQSDTYAERYWRVERQTFLRLPETGAIVFGIRIFLHSFASLRGRERFDESLKQLLSQLPATEKEYKSLA